MAHDPAAIQGGHAAHDDHGHHGHGPSGHHAHHGQHGGVGKYIAVFVALCVLTGASFFTTSSYWPYHDTPAIGRAFMMAVSCTKAMLVILFFMHMLWEASWKYVLTIPAAMMSVYLVCMLIPDVGRRMVSYSEERKQSAARQEAGTMDHAMSGHSDGAHSTGDAAAEKSVGEH
jgi:cytochrome c oxidase subunit IV